VADAYTFPAITAEGVFIRAILVSPLAARRWLASLYTRVVEEVGDSGRDIAYRFAVLVVIHRI
jgi:hypothetical protein